MKKTVINLSTEVQSERLKGMVLERTNGDLQESNKNLVKNLAKAVQMLLICENTIEMLLKQCGVSDEDKKKLFAIIDKPSTKDKGHEYPWT